MRLSECIFRLQEMAAASREYMRTQPVEEETAKSMLIDCMAMEMAAAKLQSILPRNERDETKGKAN